MDSLDACRLGEVHDGGRGGAELETMDYLEFIARVTSHIPDKGQVMVRYYGLYVEQVALMTAEESGEYE